MPTVLDATVANSAYQTSANARPQYLSNGWIVSIEIDGTRTLFLQVNKLDGNGFVPLCNISDTQIVSGGFSITSHGNFVTVIANGYTTTNDYKMYAFTFNATTQTNVNIFSTNKVIQGGLVAIQGGSLINDGSNIYGTFSAKFPSYTSSFNAAYFKGTINADGSVTWGTVEQWTTVNTTGQDLKNPTISLIGSRPIVICENQNTAGGGSSALTALSPSGLANAPVGTFAKYYTHIYSVSNTYTQSSPSAAFVPQSVNGLANGRIWVAWHGTDSTDANAWNIRLSYSDDGGVTWSAMEKRTTGNTLSQLYPSITADKNNNIYVLWSGWISTTPVIEVRKVKYSSGSWSSIVNVTSNGGDTHKYPSVLFDLSVNFTEPLFIYRSASKVGFYGTWTVTTISVTPGDIGQKTDKANLLTYSITTDGTMSAITEKVNGVTVGTKNATSGQSLIVGLTQAQWDAIRFGRYADATGGKNTLTIEMGSEKWTYTFDKRPATDADIISATKAHKDIAEVVDPARRAKMASAIRSKGGSANDADTWETMAQAVGGLAKKPLTGTLTTDSTGKFAITGLSISPKIFYAKIVSSTNDSYDFMIWTDKSLTGTTNGQNMAIRSGQAGIANNILVVSGNTVSITSAQTSYVPANTQYSWFASE